MTTKVRLYTALVRSQLTYCSPIWLPYLVQDINKLEQVQHRATKFILNDYSSDYRSSLLHLNLLPLMYIFECFDIMFLVKSLKFPSDSFYINNYVSFPTNTTKSSGIKLIHNISSINKQKHYYFVRICHLWNSLPIINLDLRTYIYYQEIP